MMRLPKFAYLAPKTMGEAARMMGEAGPAGQFVAGGTDLYPNMKRRQQTPRVVISVGRVPELQRIEGDGREGLRIGAGVSLTEIIESPVVNRDDASEHGDDWREPPARHALQLLRPELRVAQRHKLLPEEGRRHLLGRARKPEVLGRAVLRLGAFDGRDRRAAASGLDRGRQAR